MILQTDSRLREEIRVWGCYFMSLCCAANKYAGTEFTPLMINDLVDKFQARGFMQTDEQYKCFVKEPEMILQYLGLQAIYVGKIEPASHTLNPDEFHIQRWKAPGHISHFVLGARTMECGWDPWGDSRSVRDGQIMGQRVFRRL